MTRNIRTRAPLVTGPGEPNGIPGGAAQSPRRRMPAPLRGRLQAFAPSDPTIQDVRVHDLSVTGAMLEHPEPVCEGATTLLFLRLGEDDLEVGARVVWTKIHKAPNADPGTGGGLFRSGLHFSRLAAVVEGFLERFLGDLDAGEAPRRPPETGETPPAPKG